MGWVMETAKWGRTLAIKNFFTQEECNAIAQSGGVQGTVYADTINKAIFDWNDVADTSYKVDWSTCRFTMVPCKEESKIRRTSQHTLHAGNVFDDCIKIQAWINLADTDSYQGGDISIDDWLSPPYKDNFGKWVGDPDKPCQPLWLKEQGTLIIAHGGIEVGYGAALNGDAPKILTTISGPAYR
jgi:hypothetical protein